MRIPKSVNIFGKKCLIKWVSNLTDEHGVKCDGLFSSELFEIKIEASAKGDIERAFRIFLHELNHAFMERLYLNSEMPIEIEEAISEGQANLFFETIFPLLF